MAAAGAAEKEVAEVETAVAMLEAVVVAVCAAMVTGAVGRWAMVAAEAVTRAEVETKAIRQALELRRHFLRWEPAVAAERTRLLQKSCASERAIGASPIL